MSHVETISGVVERVSIYGFIVAGRYILWSFGDALRPAVGDRVEITLDEAGYAVGIQVTGWAPEPH